MRWDVYHVLTVNITKYERAGTRTHATQTICVAEEWAVDEHSGHFWTVVVRRQENFGGKVEKTKRRGRAKKGGAIKSGGKKGETQIHFQKNTQKKKQKAQLTLAD